MSDRRVHSRMRVFAVCAMTLALAAPAAIAWTQVQPQSPPDLTAAQVIANMQSFSQGLRSYQVPITMTGSARVSFVTVPFKAQGTEYYRAPNQQAIHFEGAQTIPESFQTTVASMGSPQTWPSNYTMTLKGWQQNHNHPAYVLVGVPKKHGSSVKTITMWVAAKTFAVQTVTFAYQNGATLDLDFSHHGPSPYHLPTAIAVTAKFPSYSGSANIVYGTYQTNVPVPNSAFQTQQ